MSLGLRISPLPLLLRSSAMRCDGGTCIICNRYRGLMCLRSPLTAPRNGPFLSFPAPCWAFVTLTEWGQRRHLGKKPGSAGTFHALVRNPAAVAWRLLGGGAENVHQMEKKKTCFASFIHTMECKRFRVKPRTKRHIYIFPKCAIKTY